MIHFFSLKMLDEVLHEEISLPERVHFLYSYIFFLPERVHEEASLFIRHNLREQIKAVLCRSAFYFILTLQDCQESQDCLLKIPSYTFYVILNL